MGEAFIVRKGGVSEEVLRTAVPTINFVSKTDTQIVVTFKNNDTTESEIFYGLTAPLTDSVVLADDTTSSNITFSGLDPDTQYTISAYAIVTDATLKKIKSEIVSTNITTEGFIYTAATGGTTEEYDSGGKRYRSHTFLDDGDFIVTTVGNGDRNQVDYLIIAGGGGGGGAGGGGAGGYRTTFGTQGGNGTLDTKPTVTATTYGVVVGSGGSGGGTTIAGTSGSNSSVAFATTITSTGGGQGGGDVFTASVPAGTGGSGGGAGLNGNTCTIITGANGTANQGTKGGDTLCLAGGGGGGAGQAGVDAVNTATGGGAGGDGLASTIRNGSSETRAGGGGGVTWFGQPSGTFGAGGAGGGGRGANTGNQNAASGTANTGSGGGASWATTAAAGNGGKGIVIIRYEIAPSV